MMTSVTILDEDGEVKTGYFRIYESTIMMFGEKYSGGSYRGSGIPCDQITWVPGILLE